MASDSVHDRAVRLKADIQAVLDESEQGMSEPLDIEAIKAELIAEWGLDSDPELDV